MPVDRVQAVVGRVLRIDAAAVTDRTSPQDTPTWDSVGHLNLVLEIESEFRTRFASEEILGLTSVGSIRGALERRGLSTARD